MFRMISLNLDKKLSLLSVIFMLLSIILIFVITIFNASFDLTHYQLLSQRDLVSHNFLHESFHLAEIISIVFIILLTELELFYNNDNFDSYFVALKGKKKYFYVKIISSLIILLFYTSVIFGGIMIIYLIRFKDTLYINYIFSCYLHYLLYFILYFFITFLLVLMFRNYFSAMLVFIYFWLTKLFETNNKIILAILPNVYLNIEEATVSYKINILFIFLYIAILFLSAKKVYEYRDMKLVS